MDYLLDLHREIYQVGGGWWVAIRAVKVEPSETRPHGLQYSITLHDPKGQRVLGYDNAHALAVKGRPGQEESLRPSSLQGPQEDVRVSIASRLVGGFLA